jgi:ankyrin repeat protein
LIAKTLLNAGADASMSCLFKYLNFKDAVADNGQRPIHIAVERGDTELVKMLVEANTYIDAVVDSEYTSRKNRGLTALHLAIIKGDIEMVLLLLSHGADMFLPTPGPLKVSLPMIIIFTILVF